MAANEGSWLGPDKAAHFLFIPAVTMTLTYLWSMPKLWLTVAVLIGIVWEFANHFFVFTGMRGISVKDLLAFMAGTFVTGLLVLYG